MANQANRVNQKKSGFTLIEVLMAVLLIAILATIAITQFTNFSRDTKNAATKANLGILRNAIQKHFGMMRLRCQVSGANANIYPALAALQNNDITQGGTSGCDATDVPETADRFIVAGGIPQNPWSDKDCTNKAQLLGSLSASENEMNAGVLVPNGNLVATRNCGWIYDVNTGRIKANSNRNATDRDGYLESQY
jgi:prepilin-type N-terminal cleavage/methylation domain-containing protein